MKPKSKKGFTLVELLVVIAIIGILAVVAVPSLFKHITKAKVAELKSDISMFELAIKAFYIENDRMPNQDEIPEMIEDNLNIEDTYESPFGKNYLFNCIYYENDPTKTIYRVDIGGISIDDVVVNILKKDDVVYKDHLNSEDLKDEYFRQRYTSISREENTTKSTLWVLIEIPK